MSQNLSSGEQNLILLSSLIPSNEQFYIWAYSVERGIINTSCPAEERHTLDESAIPWMSVCGFLEAWKKYGIT